MSEQGLPAAIEAERAILGAVLLDNDKYFDAVDAIHAGMFSLESHRRVWARIGHLVDSHKAADIITLSEELRQQQQLESVGGVAYLASLTDGVAVRTSIRHYVDIVRDKHVSRRLIETASLTMQRAYDQSEPISQVLAEHENDVLSIADQQIKKALTPISEIAKRHYEGIDDFFKIRPGDVPTGLGELDKILGGGFRKQDLVIVAARPSMGKTSLGMQFAERAAIYDEKVVAVFSLEMSEEQLFERQVCSMARVSMRDKNEGRLTDDEKRRCMNAWEELSASKLFIDDSGNLTVPEMRAKCRRIRNQQKRLDLIVADYLQLMDATGEQDNRVQEVTEISRGLKSVAKEFDCPLIALSQLSRATENRTDPHPKLSDLRDSGAIEQDADVVLFIFRPEMVWPDKMELKGLAELDVAKQRNGPVDSAEATFLKHCTRFENLARGAA